MDVNVDADDERNLKEEFSLLAMGHHEDEEDEEYGVGAGVAAASEKTVSHTVVGYLLAWKLAFATFENTVSFACRLMVTMVKEYHCGWCC